MQSYKVHGGITYCDTVFFTLLLEGHPPLAVLPLQWPAPKKHRCLCTYPEGFAVDYKTCVLEKIMSSQLEHTVSESKFH